MTSLLVNAEQQFIDANGKPYAGGKVYMYVPNTTTFKNTWQDINQVTLNTNPIVLDAAGRAIIYGTGQYRQQLYDVNNNLVWDQLTIEFGYPSTISNFIVDLSNGLNSSFVSTFGASAIMGSEHGPYHGVVGSIYQDSPSDGLHWSFPAAIFGYAKLQSAGNQAFALFGRVDLTTAGVGTSEINTFNYFGTPANTFPPNRGFGIATALPVTLTLGAGGNFTSQIALQILREGSAPQQYTCGIYINPDACVTYGIYIAANTTSGGPTTSMLIQNIGNNSTSAALVLQMNNATPATGSKMFDTRDVNGNSLTSISLDGRLSFAAALIQTTVGAAGAASVLPSNPTGYLQIYDTSGLKRVVPFYPAA